MSLTKSIAAVAFCAAIAAPVFAAPYASKIRVANTAVNPGVGTAISYVLDEPADSVLIELLNGASVSAAFNGTTARGMNTVNWNGRTDNTTGTVVGGGTYRVRITANKTNAAWSEVSSNVSAPEYTPKGSTYHTLFDGFSPNDALFLRDTDSDNFGTVLVNHSYNTAASRAAAAIVLNSDLSVADGSNGYASRILREATLESGAAAISNTAVWGGTIDPVTPETVYYTGQTEPTFWRGDLTSSATLIDADPSNHLGINLPRAVVVVMEGADKYAYFATANEIRKAPMNPVTNELSGTAVVISSFTSTRYARGIDADKNGNLYFVSKQVGSVGADGILLRWDAATIAGLAPTLTEANASWNIKPGVGMLNMSGPAISREDGSVYVGFATGNTVNANNGAYLVGNTATASNLKTLTLADRVVDTNFIGTPPANWNIGSINYNLRTDVAGNLLLIDRAREQIRLFARPGTTSKAITAPTSQTITIASGVDSWSMY